MTFKSSDNFFELKNHLHTLKSLACRKSYIDNYGLSKLSYCNNMKTLRENPACRCVPFSVCGLAHHPLLWCDFVSLRSVYLHVIFFAVLKIYSFKNRDF